MTSLDAEVGRTCTFKNESCICYGNNEIRTLSVIVETSKVRRAGISLNITAIVTKWSLSVAEEHHERYWVQIL